MRPRAVGLVVLLLAAPAAFAQYVDEDELEDHRRQDERYYERYAEQEDAADAEQDEEALASAYLARADELIRDKNYRSELAPHARLQTDDPRLDLGVAARLLESFRAFFDRFWSDRLELRPFESPSRVFLFYSYYKYNQLVGGDWRRSLVRPKGHYGSPLAAIVVHTDSDRPGGLANTLVHEAAHELVDRRIFAGSGRPPLWVSEGLATYFGETLMDADGNFVAGVVGGKRMALLRDGPARGSSDAALRLRALRRGLKVARADGRSPVGDVIEAEDPASFYGGNVLARYALSWLLVHFLLHGDEGAHAAAFAGYLSLEAEDRGGATAFRSAIGLTDAELDAALLAHLETIKVR